MKFNRYTMKDLKCCDSPVECERCKNCRRMYNEKDKTAVRLHKTGVCITILQSA